MRIEGIGVGGIKLGYLLDEHLVEAGQQFLTAYNVHVFVE